MEKDLITKIKNSVAKNKDLEEADVRSLMILVRKLLDNMPQSDQTPYLTIRLFSNWVAHIKITQSNTGLRILSAINNALVSVKDSVDAVAMQTKMSEAIGFPALRKEMKLFFGHIGVADILVSDNNMWAVFITHLHRNHSRCAIIFSPAICFRCNETQNLRRNSSKSNQTWGWGNIHSAISYKLCYAWGTRVG